MTVARAWLPDNALALERVRTALDPALADWARRWLGAAARVGVDSVEARAVTPDPGAVRITGPDDRLALLVSMPGKRLLFEVACAVDLAAVALGSNDHALIEAMTTEIAEDLATTLGANETGGKIADDACLRLGLTLNGRALLTIEASRAWLAGKVRALASPVRTRLPRLERRRAAIGQSRVPIDAILGRGALSLAELHSLAAGDVVLLDRAVAQGVALIVGDSSRSIAQGALGRDGVRPTICL